MKKKSFSQVIAVVIALAVGFIAGCIAETLKGNSTFYNYYNTTETLLDSIYYQQRDYFDVLIETDVYYHYQTAKEDLNN